MPNRAVLKEAVQFVRVEPSLAKIPSEVVLKKAVQLLRVELLPAEMAALKLAEPLLSWARHDSTTAPSPAKIPWDEQ
jgi:hypothetical protein